MSPSSNAFNCSMFGSASRSLSGISDDVRYVATPIGLSYFWIQLLVCGIF